MVVGSMCKRAVCLKELNHPTPAPINIEGYCQSWGDVKFLKVEFPVRVGTLKTSDNYGQLPPQHAPPPNKAVLV